MQKRQRFGGAGAALWDRSTSLGQALDAALLENDKAQLQLTLGYHTEAHKASGNGCRQKLHAYAQHIVLQHCQRGGGAEWMFWSSQGLKILAQAGNIHDNAAAFFKLNARTRRSLARGTEHMHFILLLRD